MESSFSFIVKVESHELSSKLLLIIINVIYEQFILRMLQFRSRRPYNARNTRCAFYRSQRSSTLVHMEIFIELHSCV